MFRCAPKSSRIAYAADGVADPRRSASARRRRRGRVDVVVGVHHHHQLGTRRLETRVARGGEPLVGVLREQHHRNVRMSCDVLARDLAAGVVRVVLDDDRPRRRRPRSRRCCRASRATTCRVVVQRHHDADLRSGARPRRGVAWCSTCCAEPCWSTHAAESRRRSARFSARAMPLRGALQLGVRREGAEAHRRRHPRCAEPPQAPARIDRATAAGDRREHVGFDRIEQRTERTFERERTGTRRRVLRPRSARGVRDPPAAGRARPPDPRPPRRRSAPRGRAARDPRIGSVTTTQPFAIASTTRAHSK